MPPSKKRISYCCMKYYSFLPEKIANNLGNKNSNIVNITFQIHNNFIKIINFKTEKIINKSFVDYISYGQ